MQATIETLFQKLKSSFALLEKEGKKARKFNKMIWAAAGLYYAFFFIIIARMMLFRSPGQNLSMSSYSSIIIPAIIIVIIIIPVGSLFTKKFASFKQREANLIKEVIDQLLPGYEYAAYSDQPLKQVPKSKIFKSFGPSSVAHGYLKSPKGAHPLRISDCSLQEQDSTKNALGQGLAVIPYLAMFYVMYNFVLRNLFSKKSADNVHNSFRGLFAWTKFNKTLEGHTLVVTKNLKNQFANLGKNLSLSFDHKQEIKLEDPRFTNEFYVYGTDQVEARYVLSTSLMEKILALKNKYNRPIMLSFREDRMYLAVNIPHGVLSFYSKDLSSSLVLQEVFDTIKTTEDIVNDFNLDKNIWKSPA